MPDNMTHLTTRVPQQVIKALDDLAKQRRMQTGDDVRRADLVREALANMAKGELAVEPTRDNFGLLILNALEQLADEAERQSIEDTEDMAMTLGATAEQDSRTERLRVFVNKVHGTLQSV